VAHRLEIPVEFRFDVEVVKWTRGTGKPVGWLRSSQGRELLLELKEPIQYRGARQQISLQFLPSSFAAELRTCAQMHDSRRHLDPWGPVVYGGPYVPDCDPAYDSDAARHIRTEFGDREIQLLVCHHPESDLEEPLRQIVLVDSETQECTFLGEERPFRTHNLDPWDVRQEFLRLRRTTDQLLGFLNKWGQWSLHTRPSRPFATNSRQSKEFDIAFVLPDSIWADQGPFAQALLSTPSDWFARTPPANFLPKETFPYYVCLVSTCREAIRTTITVDFLRDLKFRLCALKDCNQPFSIESKHKRKYCCQYHGHLASIRRSRKLAAK
jgi:hypothetical protein